MAKLTYHGLRNACTSLLIQSEGRQNPGAHDCPGGLYQANRLIHCETGCAGETGVVPLLAWYTSVVWRQCPTRRRSEAMAKRTPGVSKLILGGVLLGVCLGGLRETTALEVGRKPRFHVASTHGGEINLTSSRASSLCSSSSMAWIFAPTWWPTVSQEGRLQQFPGVERPGFWPISTNHPFSAEKCLPSRSNCPTRCSATSRTYG